MEIDGLGWVNAEKPEPGPLWEMGVLDMWSSLVWLLFKLALVLGNADSVGLEGILENVLCPKTEVVPEELALNPRCIHSSTTTETKGTLLLQLIQRPKGRRRTKG